VTKQQASLHERGAHGCRSGERLHARARPMAPSVAPAALSMLAVQAEVTRLREANAEVVAQRDALALELGQASVRVADFRERLRGVVQRNEEHRAELARTIEERHAPLAGEETATGRAAPTREEEEEAAAVFPGEAQRLRDELAQERARADSARGRWEAAEVRADSLSAELALHMHRSRAAEIACEEAQRSAEGLVAVGSSVAQQRDATESRAPWAAQELLEQTGELLELRIHACEWPWRLEAQARGLEETTHEEGELRARLARLQAAAEMAASAAAEAVETAVSRARTSLRQEAEVAEAVVEEVAAAEEARRRLAQAQGGNFETAASAGAGAGVAGIIHACVAETRAEVAAETEELATVTTTGRSAKEAAPDEVGVAEHSLVELAELQGVGQNIIAVEQLRAFWQDLDVACRKTRPMPRVGTKSLGSSLAMSAQHNNARAVTVCSNSSPSSMGYADVEDSPLSTISDRLGSAARVPIAFGSSSPSTACSSPSSRWGSADGVVPASVTTGATAAASQPTPTAAAPHATAASVLPSWTHWPQYRSSTPCTTRDAWWEGPPPLSPQSRAHTERRRALLVGVNYHQTPAELHCAWNDVATVRDLLLRLGFSQQWILCLTDDNTDPVYRPSRGNLLAAMRWLTHNVVPGDGLFFHFSGHGARLPVSTGCDGIVEGICPEDFQKEGLVSEAELFELLVHGLPPDVRLTALLDCCHPGVAMGLPFLGCVPVEAPAVALEVTLQAAAAVGDVICFALCADEQELNSVMARALYSRTGGVLTTAFARTMGALAARQQGPVTYLELLVELQGQVRSDGVVPARRPQLSVSRAFDPSARAFRLSDAHPAAAAAEGGCGGGFFTALDAGTGVGAAATPMRRRWYGGPPLVSMLEACVFR